MCGLRVWVVVMVKVRSAVDVRATLIERVGSGRRGWVRVMGEVRVGGMGGIKHS